MPRLARDEVAAAIVRADPAFGAVVARHGPPPQRRAARVDERFGTLATSILHQQLAMAAARAIHARVVAAVGTPMTPRGILRAGDERLASCGVSGPKRRSLLDLARRAHDGSLDLASLGRRSDEDVATELTSVLGIGPWTAHMFCMVTLARPDVWPVGDLGVRAGWAVVHGLDEPIAPKALLAAGDRFTGHRSAVAWYCWRAVEAERAARQPS